MRAWALSAGLGFAAAACSAVPVDPYVVPREKLSEIHLRRVDEVLADVAAAVELDAEEVKSRPEIYEFLLDEMPFTGGVVRELNRGTWDIFRDPQEPDPAVFYVIDPEGIRLRFELIHRDALRRFYLTRGSFDMGLFGRLMGRTLIVLRTVPERDILRTDAKIFVRVDSAGAAGLAKLFKDLLAAKVRERSGYFIDAARWVAEEAALRPEWLHTQVKGSRQVDPAVLEEFRRRFLVR